MKHEFKLIIDVTDGVTEEEVRELVLFQLEHGNISEGNILNPIYEDCESVNDVELI